MTNEDEILHLIEGAVLEALGLVVDFDQSVSFDEDTVTVSVRIGSGENSMHCAVRSPTEQLDFAIEDLAWCVRARLVERAVASLRSSPE